MRSIEGSYFMNGTTSEWVKKADGDFDVAQLAFRAELNPNHDAVCFRCQQCVEKHVKAVLIQDGVSPPKTHNLERLHEILHTLRPKVALDLEELCKLTCTGVGHAITS